MSADAHEYLNTVEPIRFTDDRGNPGLSYTGQQVVNAYKAGAAAGSPSPATKSGPKCKHCDDTGYYDYAGLSMDPCHHCGPDSPRAEVAREPSGFECVRDELTGLKLSTAEAETLIGMIQGCTAHIGSDA